MEWIALQEKRRFGSIDGWSYEFVQGLPRQQNMSDCGVRVCDYARMIVAGNPAEPLCKPRNQLKNFGLSFLFMRWKPLYFHISFFSLLVSV